jgi:hypothetical protein
MMITQYWVIGGEFKSMNFHSFNDGTVVVSGPFKTRAAAEEVWKTESAKYRPNAGYRFVITEEHYK